MSVRGPFDDPVPVHAPLSISSVYNVRIVKKVDSRNWQNRLNLVWSWKRPLQCFLPRVGVQKGFEPRHFEDSCKEKKIIQAIDWFEVQIEHIFRYVLVELFSWVFYVLALLFVQLVAHRRIDLLPRYFEELKLKCLDFHLELCSRERIGKLLPKEQIA